jgi:methionyl-tRNA formyltransferase
MKSIGIILTPDTRSQAYIQKTINKNFVFDKILLMNDQRPQKQIEKNEIEIGKKYGFDVSVSVKDFLDEKKLEYREFDFVDINHPELIKFLQNSTIDYFIFTGGGILKNNILRCGPKFIHFHPGIVPNYKGSTCFYYSFINDDKCGVTAFLMNEGIDTGDIIFQKEFSKPDHIHIDNIFDAHIRSETLLDLLKTDLIEQNNYTQQIPEEGETYFVIHPVLKHIAIISCVNSKISK